MKRNHFLIAVFLFYNLNCFAQERITLLFAGDAMQHSSQLNSLIDWNQNFENCFQLLQPVISKADIAIVNLETTLSGKPYRGYPNFCAPDKFAQALAKAGFNLFLTANNHCYDRGLKGAVRTIRTLDSLNIQHTGTFINSEQKKLLNPLIYFHKGFRFAFLNYTEMTNGIVVKPPFCVNYMDTLTMRFDIEKAILMNPDLIIVCLHWGDEYQLLPNKKQKRIADWLISKGVRVVIGSHPHVVQPMHARSDSSGNINSVIAYSLGNFISGMRTNLTKGGAMIQLVVKKENKKIKIDSVNYALLYTVRTNIGGNSSYQLHPALPCFSTYSTPSNPGMYDMNLFFKTTQKFLKMHNIGIYEEFY